MKNFLLIGALVVVLATAKAATLPATPAISAEDPIAIIGLAQGKQFLGAIVVTRDGSLHASTEITLEQAQAIAKTLGKGHSMVAAAPGCDHGVETSL